LDGYTVLLEDFSSGNANTSKWRYNAWLNFEV
jgi:hypothetical protein